MSRLSCGSQHKCHVQKENPTFMNQSTDFLSDQRRWKWSKILYITHLSIVVTKLWCSWWRHSLSIVLPTYSLIGYGLASHFCSNIYHLNQKSKILFYHAFISVCKVQWSYLWLIFIKCIQSFYSSVTQWKIDMIIQHCGAHIKDMPRRPPVPPSYLTLLNDGWWWFIDRTVEGH